MAYAPMVPCALDRPGQVAGILQRSAGVRGGPRKNDIASAETLYAARKKAFIVD
jgi:hypothetical protein